MTSNRSRETDNGPANGAGAILIAISGPSCSGKTTLARLLRDTISPASIVSDPLLQSPPSEEKPSQPEQESLSFIVHEDDFYVTDARIPVVEIGDRQVQDWDCRDAIDLPLFERMLNHVKRTGHLEPGFESKEDTNAVGQVDIDWHTIGPIQQRLRKEVQNYAQQTGHRIAIVDGFLLFARGFDIIMSTFDVRLLLTIDHSTMKQRREARKGYVTLEGFWEDPPGYVDDIVWPNYVKDHSFLYIDGNVESGEGIDLDACRELGINSRPAQLVGDMTGCFEWAAEIIIEHLRSCAQ